jgi:hypothetical protein
LFDFSLSKRCVIFLSLNPAKVRASDPSHVTPSHFRVYSFAGAQAARRLLGQVHGREARGEARRQAGDVPVKLRRTLYRRIVGHHKPLRLATPTAGWSFLASTKLDYKDALLLPSLKFISPSISTIYSRYFDGFSCLVPGFSGNHRAIRQSLIIVLLTSRLFSSRFSPVIRKGGGLFVCGIVAFFVKPCAAFRQGVTLFLHKNFTAVGAVEIVSS